MRAGWLAAAALTLLAAGRACPNADQHMHARLEAGHAHGVVQQGWHGNANRFHLSDQVIGKGEVENILVCLETSIDFEWKKPHPRILFKASFRCAEEKFFEPVPQITRNPDDHRHTDNECQERKCYTCPRTPQIIGGESTREAQDGGKRSAQPGA